MDSILSFLAFGVVLYFLYYFIIVRNNQKKKFVSDENSFQQAGVTINYVEQTIQIEKHTYKVSQITGIKSTVRDTKAGEQINIRIEVDDMEKPVHLISFMGKHNGDVFMQRLSVALRKAGGPSFI